MSNLKPVLTEDQIERIQEEKKKVQQEVQENIINQGHSNQIFAEIKRINKEMTQRMKLKIDIKEKSMIKDANFDSSSVEADRQAQFEIRLNKYIQDFINLNFEHERALDKTSQKLDVQMEKRADIIEENIRQYIEKIRRSSAEDQQKNQKVKEELEFYVLELHQTFEDIEAKRLKETQDYMQLIEKLKKDNVRMKSLVNS